MNGMEAQGPKTCPTWAVHTSLSLQSPSLGSRLADDEDEDDEDEDEDDVFLAAPT